jgi:DNA-directed RNA polymerase specialized sigma24 family protein
VAEAAKFEDIPAHLDSVIHAIARRVSRSGRGLLDEADLRQECYMWVLTHWDRVVADHADPEDMKYPIGYFRKIMYRVAQKAVLRERVARTGGQPEDFFYYSITIIEELLPAVFDRGDWAARGVSDDQLARRKPKAPNESGDYLAMLCDVSRAYESLPYEDRRVIRLRFAPPGRSFDDLGRLWGVVPSTAHRRVAHVLEKVVDFLGGESPWH